MEWSHRRLTLTEILSANLSHCFVECTDADTVVALSARTLPIDGPIGVWLTPSAKYSAQLIARDVATLSHLLRLTEVAVTTLAHADIVEALLQENEVTIANEVATITKAFNRPSPPHKVRVWYRDGEVLRSGEELLRLH